MKHFIWPLFVLLLQFATAQNLVPNGSFEVGTCPTFASQLDYAQSWTNPTLGTPEYYSECAAPTSYVMPPSVMINNSYQFARTGQAYIGLYTYRQNIPNMREYAEVTLTTPLVAGQCYYFEMFVNHPDGFGIATDGMGAHFSTTAVSATNSNVLPFTPQVVNSTGNLIVDSIGWTKVSGYFTADGGEQYLTIGNFNDDNNTVNSTINPLALSYYESYLFVDDVSLVAIDKFLDIGPDTLLCDDASVFLDAAIGAQGYVWQDGEVDSTRTVNTAGEYWVNAILGGCVFSDTLQVNVMESPQLNWEADTSICANSSFSLSAWNAASSYLWHDNSTQPEIEIQEEGIYYCTVNNQCGTATDTLNVFLEDCRCTVYVPNAFSPNSDQLNDVLAPVFECDFLEYDLRLFDRWGRLVFQTSDPFFGWDGKFNGKLAPIDVYVYQLDYRLNGGVPQQAIGSVALVR